MREAVVVGSLLHRCTGPARGGQGVARHPTLHGCSEGRETAALAVLAGCSKVGSTSFGAPCGLLQRLLERLQGRARHVRQSSLVDGHHCLCRRRRGQGEGTAESTGEATGESGEESTGDSSGESIGGSRGDWPCSFLVQAREAGTKTAEAKC